MSQEMKDLVNLIAKHVGDHEMYRRKVESLVARLIIMSDDMSRNPGERRRKHMGEGIRLAIRSICFELQMGWGV